MVQNFKLGRYSVIIFYYDSSTKIPSNKKKKCQASIYKIYATENFSTFEFNI